MIETAWSEGLFMTVSLMNLDNRTSELLMQINPFEVPMAVSSTLYYTLWNAI